MKTRTVPTLFAFACVACAPAPGARSQLNFPTPPAAQSAASDNARVATEPETSPAAAPATSAPASSTNSLTSAFAVEHDDGTTTPLWNDATLHDGERFSMTFNVARAMHVVIVYVDGKDGAAVLYPRADSTTDLAILNPGPAQRVPSDPGDAFQLDDKPGVERLIVIASEQPLPQSDIKLANLIADVRKSGRWPLGVFEKDSAAGAPTADAPPAPAPTVGTPPGGSLATRPPAAGPARTQRTTPVVMNTSAPQAGREVTDNMRGPLKRGTHVVHKQSGKVEFRPDAGGVVAIPLFINHVH